MFATIIDRPRREEQKEGLPTLSVLISRMATSDKEVLRPRELRRWDIETIKPLNNMVPVSISSLVISGKCIGMELLCQLKWLVQEGG